MKPFRFGLFSLIALALSPIVSQTSFAGVRTLRPTQTLPKPDPSFQSPLGVAIDGTYIIVIAAKTGTGSNTYVAQLFRKNISDSKWVFRKTLLAKTGYFSRTEVRMKGGIAAVQFGGTVSLFEHVNGDYVLARSVAPIVHPGGIAISSGRVLVGGDDCSYDGVVYEKGANGLWGITGRLNDHTGACETYGITVELNYNYALLRGYSGGPTTAWRRNGTALDWVPDGVLTPPPGISDSQQPYTLQGATAVATNGYAYLRTGSSTWQLKDRATSVDYDNNSGFTFEAVYREGVLVTTESGAYQPFPRVYVETAPATFEHLASLFTSNMPTEIDYSLRTVVALVRDYSSTAWDVEVFTLPEPLAAPRPIVNDFEDRNASDFETLSGQFQLATRGTDDVLAQSNSGGLAIALAKESDWTTYQRVEVDISPTFAGSAGWVGVIARYVDPDNYYYAAIRADGTFRLIKRAAGVETVLRQTPLAPASIHKLVLLLDGNQVFAGTNANYNYVGIDNSLPHGRAGLATFQARADFDDVFFTGAPQYGLFYREWGPSAEQYDIDLTTLGGNWQIPLSVDGYSQGLKQIDKSGDARAFIGVPVSNQYVSANVRLDSFGTSSQGAWFGLLARYVDARNHYYVTVRSTGQIQIRKIVNGVITVLASAAYTAVPGQDVDLTLSVINDQLQLLVNGVVVASAHDGAIASGKYGLATYRAAVTWESMGASTL